MAHRGFPEKRPARTGAAGRHAASGLTAEGFEEDILTTLSWRLARGEFKAMDEFYDLTCDRSYGLARTLLGRSKETETLLCGAYLDAWRTICATRPSPGTEMRWILSLVLSRYRQGRTAPDRASPAIRRSGD